MIQVKKDNLNVPVEYLELIERYHFRKIDFDSGHHTKPKPTGHELFKKIKKKSSIFESFKTKLLKDQGYICCYCNARVFLKNSTVEHLTPISIDKSLLAEYSNLLIACNGGKDDKFNNEVKEDTEDDEDILNVESTQNEYPLFCDAHRKNAPLPFTPLDKDCWSAFNYSIVDGSTSASNTDAQQVIDILNLNCGVLQKNRLEALSILFDDNQVLISYEEMVKIWDNLWKRDRNGMFEPYFFVIVQNIYFLL
jgi:uncharacterized protein (TIGR02646 family)